MRTSTWIFVGGLLVAGCARAQESAPPAVTKPAPTHAQSHAPAPVPLAPEGVDATQATDTAAEVTFTSATSGTCDPIRLLAHGRETYISYGRRTLARLLPDGSLTDLGFPDIRSNGEFHEQVTVAAIEAVTGDDLHVRVRQGRYRDQFFRRHAGVWTNLDEDMRRNIADLAPWLDGSVLASGLCYRDNPGPCGGLALQAFGGSTEAPKFPELSAPDGCNYFEFTTAPDGRILASGGLCRADGRNLDDQWTVVRWSPADGTTYERFPMTDDDWYPGPVAIRGPSHMFATVKYGDSSDRRSMVAAFDGAAWTLLPPLAGHVAQLADDTDGRPWLRMLDGRLVRYTAAGQWDRLAFPTGEVRDFGGLRDAWAWVVETNGTLWLRPSGGKFARATLRRPEFGEQQLRAERVALAGDELWVTVGYNEKASCLLLLRSAAPSTPGPSITAPTTSPRTRTSPKRRAGASGK